MEGVFQCERLTRPSFRSARRLRVLFQIINEAARSALTQIFCLTFHERTAFLLGIDTCFERRAVNHAELLRRHEVARTLSQRVLRKAAEGFALVIASMIP